MKELSIEDKAKRYDKAYEMAKKLKETCDSNAVVGWMEYIFPELKESEDERIREKVIATIHLYYGEPLEDEAKEMIAWLEKQGEHANFRNKIQIGDKVTRNEDGVLVNLSQLNRVAKKQGENNMGISEATKQKLEDNLNKALEKETPESCNEFLDKQCEQKPYGQRQECVDCQFNYAGECKGFCGMKQGEQKSAWSEEDKEMSRFIGNAITTNDASEYLESKAIQVIDARVWLYGLKDRVQPQPKQEWSEEDENAIQVLKDIVKHSNEINENIYTMSLKEKLYDWLKSLRHQSTWKPSDEQMTQLKKYCPDNRPLTSLYEQLKKLREE